VNYRHIFHAGNFADVFKHALLSRVLLYLGQKPAAFRYIDTHAGTGSYNLASEAARRSPEWKDGIARLTGANLPPDVAPLLAPYLAFATPMLAGDSPSYPGSPLIARHFTRSQDRLCLIEKHPVDIRHLRAATAGDRRVKALELDGWTAWNAQVPPPEKRGLVLVDPPFEEEADWQRMIEGLKLSHRKWPGGTTLLWYPAKDPRRVDGFIDALEDTGIAKTLRLELAVDRQHADGPLAATGLVVVNPPYTLVEEARLILPFLARRLARGPGAGWRAEWIAEE